MAIKRIEMEDYLVFEGKFAIDFCEGVNVFIGANATGKTTILKAIYGYNPLVIDSDEYKKLVELYTDIEDGEADIILKGNIVFRTNLKFLPSKYSPKSVKKDLKKSNDIVITAIYGNLIKKDHTFNYTLYYTNDKEPENINFIPVDEMLSHSKSLMALNHERKIPFRPEEIDILAKAELGEANELLEYEEELLAKLSKIIGGIVIYDKDTFYIQKEKDGKLIEFSDEASGYKKLGLLWKLIRNGLIRKDTVLLWDEPENSLNPEHMSELVDILFELSRNGVQIFVTTHNEIFAKYFDINKNEEDNLTFFSLYREKENSPIKLDTDKSFDSLEPNQLIHESVSQYEKEIEKGV